MNGRIGLGVAPLAERAPRPMRIQLAAAILLLAGIVAGLKWLLNAALIGWGFWPYAAICVVITVSAIAAAFAFDRHEARVKQSQRQSPR